MNKEQTQKQNMRRMLKSFELKVDTVGSTIERRFLSPMIDEAKIYANELMNDYKFLVSHEVKEMVLKDFMCVQSNIRVLKFVNKHHTDVIPTLERIGTTKDIQL